MLSAKPAEVSPPPKALLRPAHPSFFPFHIVPGLSNFRDIGGWPISSTSHVRKGVVYRGSDTNRVTPDGEKKLRELGVRTDFDLRSTQQIQKTGGYKEIDGIDRKWLPVFEDEQYTEEAAKKRYELYAGEGTNVQSPPNFSQDPH